MCLFGKSPAWEDDIVFANRRRGHRSHRTRVTETTVVRTPKYSPPPAARTPTPIIHSPSPPPLRAPSPKPAPPPPPPQPTIELVSVEEDRSSSSHTRTSIPATKKSRKGSSRGGEEVYIERERVVERRPPPPLTQEEYETFRYVEAPMPPRREAALEERTERRRSRSITYQSSPRASGRVMERERVVIEDGGRRREYYRKP